MTVPKQSNAPLIEPMMAKDGNMSGPWQKYFTRQSAIASAMYVDSNGYLIIEPPGGRVGINNTEPLSTLDVIGDVRFGDSTTNYSSFESDGTLVFNGDATVWDDLRVPAQNTKLTPSKSEPAFESLIGGLYVYKFDTSNADDESVHFIAQMPHGYKEGSDIYPHLHWCPDSTNTGNVYWSFEYTIANINGTIGATTTDFIIVPADGTSLKHQLDNFAVIDGTGLTISHIIICRLTRRSTSQATDTYTGNACFLEFDFHFEKDTVGSREEITK